MPGREQVTLLPAVMLVLLPKCPLCFAAWAGIFGAVGTSAWVRSVYGLPLTLALASAAFLSLCHFARRKRDLRPAWLGACGLLLIYTGKQALDLAWIEIAGIALLGAATWWTRLTRAPGGGRRSQG